MSSPLFDRPVLNSPYEIPTRHWELDTSGQPTQRILDTRRKAYWVAGVNHLGTHGRGAFAELGDVPRIGADFKAKVQSQFDAMITGRVRG
jgi:hypothetical protein